MDHSLYIHPHGREWRTRNPRQLGSSQRDSEPFGSLHLRSNVARYSAKATSVGMADLALRSPGNLGRILVSKAKVEGPQGSVPTDMRSGSCWEHLDDDVGQPCWFCCRS